MARLLRWSMKNGWPCHSIKYLFRTISKFYISVFFASLFTSRASRASHFLDGAMDVRMGMCVNWSLIFPFFLFCVLLFCLSKLFNDYYRICWWIFFSLLLLSSFIPFPSICSHHLSTFPCGSFNFNVTNVVWLDYWKSAISMFMFEQLNSSCVRYAVCINCDLSNIVNRRCMWYDDT